MNTTLATREYLLKPGYIVLHQEPALVYIVLGTCVAVSFFDHRFFFGGICHFQYPNPQPCDRPTARFGSLALPKLYQMMLKSGSRVESLYAQVFGGSDQPGCSVGQKNTEMALQWLNRFRIEITSMDVGGTTGRKIMINTATSETVISKPGRIRSADWYPYLDKR